MVLTSSSLWLWCVCLLCVCEGEGALITRLPGQPQVSFDQFSGYLPVDLHSGRSFFYYFVQAQHLPSSKPLTLWLNGGPGCSSVGLGAFTENGPFRVSPVSGELILNLYSWNTVSNVLYLDSPAGVGWSYSNTSTDLSTDDTSTARDNFVFLQEWFKAFPEYKKNEFFIVGESYAGHYAPQLAAMVVDHNSKGGHSVINLKGMAVGNPILNGLVDFEERIAFRRWHGLISDQTYEAVVKNCNFSVFATASEACEVAYAELEREIGDYTDPYDILSDVCLPSALHQTARLRHLANPSSQSTTVDVCIEDELSPYMNRPDVQLAFHANTTGLPYPWSYCSTGPNALQYDESNIDDSMLPVLAHLLEANVRVLVYSGDQDTVLPFSGSRKQVHELAGMMKLKTTVRYRPWYEGGQVGGWTQGYGNLTFATVRGAAHTVPNSSPARALKLFTSFLKGPNMPLVHD